MVTQLVPQKYGVPDGDLVRTYACAGAGTTTIAAAAARTAAASSRERTRATTNISARPPRSRQELDVQKAEIERQIRLQSGHDDRPLLDRRAGRERVLRRAAGPAARQEVAPTNGLAAGQRRAPSIGAAVRIGALELHAKRR